MRAHRIVLVTGPSPVKPRGEGGHTLWVVALHREVAGRLLGNEALAKERYVTKDRDFKKVVREEAQRTGSSYQRTREMLETAAGAEERSDVEEFTPIESAVGQRVADLALRLADGKPVVPGPPWTSELSELMRAALAARDAADAPTASSREMEAAAQAAQRFEEARRRLDAQPLPSAEGHLNDVIGGRTRVALAGADACRRLLDLNPADRVARQAMQLLLHIAKSMDEA